MTHFGLITEIGEGHLRTMLPLGQELKRRGHHVTHIGTLDEKGKVLGANLEAWTIGQTELPLGATTNFLIRLGELNGFESLQYGFQWVKEHHRVFLEYVPRAVQESGIEALVIDKDMPSAISVAEFLKVPFVTISSSAISCYELNVPPFITAWPYGTDWWSRLRNFMGYKLFDFAWGPSKAVIDDYRRQWKLPIRPSAYDYQSPLLQLTHQPAAFEFPRQQLPPHFHFTGPYHYSASREPVPFPYEELTGQPLIYASLGTIQGRHVEVFQYIATACQDLEMQLVISLGGAEPSLLPSLGGQPIVVQYAPQLELLQKASLVITHGGMNTTLESLTNGIPLVAIPILGDQFGIAARIAWTGAGKFIPYKAVQIGNLQSAIQEVLTVESYKQNALRLQEAIRNSGGVTHAAALIEQAVNTGQPVLRELG
jgi:MGT family glycosyltransferase